MGRCTVAPAHGRQLSQELLCCNIIPCGYRISHGNADDRFVACVQDLFSGLRTHAYLQPNLMPRLGGIALSLFLLPESLSLPPRIGCYSLRGLQLRMVRFRRRGSCLMLSSRCCRSHPPKSSSLFRLPACFPTDITESGCHQPLRAIAHYPTVPGGAQAREMLFLVASLHTTGNTDRELADCPAGWHESLASAIMVCTYACTCSYFTLCFALLQQHAAAWISRPLAHHVGRVIA